MHFSINAHAVQGFSLKQVRACLRLEPLSLKLNGSRCGLAYGLPCGLLYVLLYGFLYGLLCGLLYSLLRELLYGLLCTFALYGFQNRRRDFRESFSSRPLCQLTSRSYSHNYRLSQDSLRPLGSSVLEGKVLSLIHI